MYLFGADNFKLSFTEKGISACSGTIRGAIAFGLSISIVSDKKLNRDILLSTTLSLVFISTIVFGALMPYIIKFWRGFEEKKISEDEDKIQSLNYVNLDHEDNINNPNESVRFSYLHPNFDINIQQFSKEKDLEVLKKRLSYWLGTYWLQFDDAYVKPKLICNWPEVKKEHDEIAEVITDVIKNYLEEKKKVKEDNNNGNEEGNEMNEGLINYDKNEEFKTTYMKLRDDQDENDNEDEHHDYRTNYQHLQDEQDENDNPTLKKN